MLLLTAKLGAALLSGKSSYKRALFLAMDAGLLAQWAAEP